MSILLAVNSAARGEVYSSASDMKEIFRLERELVSIMSGFASKLQSKLNNINSYIEVIAKRSKFLRKLPYLFASSRVVTTAILQRPSQSN